MGKVRNEAGPGEDRLGNHAQLLSSLPTEALTKLELGAGSRSAEIPLSHEVFRTSGRP